MLEQIKIRGPEGMSPTQYQEIVALLKNKSLQQSPSGLMNIKEVTLQTRSPPSMTSHAHKRREIASSLSPPGHSAHNHSNSVISPYKLSNFDNQSYN
jgi:hypothetical protein